MKSQLLTLLLLAIGALLFQPAYPFRLRKRELTEYDLTSFIVNTCSADKIEVIIQNLCDQTYQSALLGNFPFLTYYCKMIGSGNRYCDNINRQTLAPPKRWINRRSLRSLPDGEVTTKHRDFDVKKIIELCLTSTEKDLICSRTLKKQIDRLCKTNNCREILSLWPSTTSVLPSSTSSSSASYLSSSINEKQTR